MGIKIETRCQKKVKMLKTKVDHPVQSENVVYLGQVMAQTEECQCILTHNHPGCHIMQFEGERWPVD